MASKNEEIAEELEKILRERSGSYDEQVKIVSILRVKIQPRASHGDWRGKAKIIERPSGGIMGKGKSKPAEKGEK